MKACWSFRMIFLRMGSVPMQTNIPVWSIKDKASGEKVSHRHAPHSSESHVSGALNSVRNSSVSMLKSTLKRIAGIQLLEWTPTPFEESLPDSPVWNWQMPRQPSYYCDLSVSWVQIPQTPLCFCIKFCILYIAFISDQQTTNCLNGNLQLQNETGRPSTGTSVAS